MNDQAAWNQALTTTSGWYFDLPPDSRLELDGLIEEIMQIKQKLVDLVTASGSSTICRNCGGMCCLLGKYHFSVLDLLAYRKSGNNPPVPDFTSSPACPYSDTSGCSMSPRYRPTTCVIFNCQLIEERLTPAERTTFRDLETKLRDTVAHTGRVHKIRLDRPLLLSGS